jgi:hypothetical protein
MAIPSLMKTVEVLKGTAQTVVSTVSSVLRQRNAKLVVESVAAEVSRHTFLNSASP